METEREREKKALTVVKFRFYFYRRSGELKNRFIRGQMQKCMQFRENLKENI